VPCHKDTTAATKERAQGVIRERRGSRSPILIGLCDFDFVRLNMVAKSRWRLNAEVFAVKINNLMFA